ncbi:MULTISPECIES: GerAB/ArcD/ProY family transporter [unclassified Sporosarcina]|uniref:GerAB/ArcD/ProY family transporter n=1 Tax=unclassified Sporosarcina TaxID=2647733 RepID=UPI002041B3BA|nr:MULTISPECIES: GerAB/ArcD/ProY family transporter [unclassified Sporosarcina]GKV65330.1 hypothetical protein NCCP2331_14830 [Sporosarcina sp. NCCP-2331]GLB55454.1 hypothetical protein NCCP2378_12410 [Sporosarcina sp. NCCP-2378]
MSRFIYFLIISNMVANIIASIPRILLSESEDGAVLSMILALFYGVFAIWVLIKCLQAFPGKSVPELFSLYLSRWIGTPVLFILGVIWYIAGLQTLIAYVAILSRFLTPEMSIYVILASFVLILTFGILMQSRNVLFSLELIFVILLPFVFFFIMKTYFTEQLDWDQVSLALTHTHKVPSYTTFAAAAYLFIGAFDLVIFNSLMKKKLVFKWKQALVIFLLGLFIMTTTYLIPIGILGFDKIEDFIYPWVSTSDSMRMKFGVIERVTFLFLLNFLAIAFLNIFIHWHVAYKLFQSTFGVDKLPKGKRKNYSKAIMVTVFWSVAVFFTVQETEYDLFLYTGYYFNSLPVVFSGLTVLLMIVNRRAKRGT